MRTLLRVLAALTITGAAGCGDDGDERDGGPDAASSEVDAQPGPDAGEEGPLVGQILVREVAAAQPWSWVTAAFESDGIVLREQLFLEEGDCRMYRSEPAYCTSCDGWCVATEVCVPYEQYVCAGTLTTSGLTTPLTLPCDGSGTYYQPGVLPDDLFMPGADISVAASGDVIPAFTVGAKGVPSLEVALGGAQADEITLINGADNTIAWTPGDGSARVRVTLRSPSLGGHGSPLAAIIECDTADDGSVVVPRAMVEAFPPQGRVEICVAIDCPMSSAMRYSRGVVRTAAGDVELLVGSQVDFYLLHPASFTQP